VPNPLDASSGTYNTVQETWADSHFGSQANFNRLDGTNSSYYKFGKLNQWIVARSTRIASERSYGTGDQELIPLPERLYAGGAQSHRGFGINAAGPRDSITGFPIGGAGAFINNTELRMPPPTLPYVGNSLGFVLFHDMGNVFENSSDIWSSFFRIKQPHSYTCKDLSLEDQEQPHEHSSTGGAGTCSFNNFVHAVGLGARYHTPVGPIRLDFSYNLNPPIYPIIIDYSGGPTRVGQAGHFNFFFSIGQAF
jgi:outer membrane protein insertion porin family